MALIGRFHPADYRSEDELLAACRRRDLGAFEQLYNAHGARLKSIAYHLMGNRQDAEDAVQETFLKVCRAIDGFHSQSSISTWICRICINTCYDLARKRRAETDRDVGPHPEHTGQRNQLALRIQLDDALRRINPRHRMVFLLFEVEGLRHSEIASILEVPEGTSKAWLFEAKRELKRLLTEVR